MAGPWEQYQPQEKGPWQQYANDSAPKRQAGDATYEGRLGIGEIPQALGAAAIGAAAAVPAGLAGIVGGLLPGPEGQSGNWTRAVHGALTPEPTSRAGAAVADIATKPFQWLGQAADWAGGKTTDITGSPAAGAAVNTALQMAPAAAGMVAQRLKGIPAEDAAGIRIGRQVQDVSRNLSQPAIVDALDAKAAGYSRMPNEINPSITNQMVTGIGGKSQIAQSLSLKNQPVTDLFIKRDFGIPDEVPLSRAIFQDVRAEAGKVYEAARNSGDVLFTPAKIRELDSLAGRFRKLQETFPDEANNPIVKTVDSIKSASANGVDAGTLIDKIGALREARDKAFLAKDSTYGHAYSEISKVLEDQLDLHLRAVGAPKAQIMDLREARKTIAKSYLAERALKDEHIDANVLAAAHKKGSPLDGNMLRVAKFASRNSKVAKLPEQVGGPVIGSLGDIGLGAAGIAGAAASGNFIPLLAVGARPGLRAIAASNTYQSMLSPSVGADKFGIMPRSFAPLAIGGAQADEEYLTNAKRQ